MQGHTATLLGNGLVLIAGGVSGTTVVSAARLYDASFALACTSNSQCTTGFCVNGVCCDTACNGGCGACNLPGKVGTCSALAEQHGLPGVGGRLRRGRDLQRDVAHLSDRRLRARDGAAARRRAPATWRRTAPGRQRLPGRRVPAASTTVCRAAADVCDVAETCTGTSRGLPGGRLRAGDHGLPPGGWRVRRGGDLHGHLAACPADAFVARRRSAARRGRLRRGRDLHRDSAACPADGFAPPTTVCRASVGVCDVAETCTGATATCPPTVLAVPTTVCRGRPGCATWRRPARALRRRARRTAATADDGLSRRGRRLRRGGDLHRTSVDCPPDGFLPVDDHLPPAVGACDLAETCTGAGTACPADGKARRRDLLR